MSNIDYKLKYQELKLKYMSAVDASYRLGFQAGAQQAQVQQAQEQQAQQQAMEQASMQSQGQSGQEGNDESAGEEDQSQQPGQEAGPMGSELDQHIAQLESMLGKTEPGTEAYNTLKKSLDGIRGFRQSQVQSFEMKKAEQAIKVIGKALSKPAKTVSQQAQANLNTTAKRALSKQEEILKDVFSQWENEETNVQKSVAEILNVEGLTTKE